MPPPFQKQILKKVELLGQGGFLDLKTRLIQLLDFISLVVERTLSKHVSIFLILRVASFSVVAALAFVTGARCINC